MKAAWRFKGRLEEILWKLFGKSRSINTRYAYTADKEDDEKYWISKDNGGSVTITFPKDMVAESLILRAPIYLNQHDLAEALKTIGINPHLYSWVSKDFDCASSYSGLKLNVDGQTVATSPLTNKIQQNQTFDVIDWAGDKTVQGKEFTLQWASNRRACASFIQISVKEGGRVGNGALAKVVRGDDAPSGVTSGKGSKAFDLSIQASPNFRILVFEKRLKLNIKPL